MWNKNNGDNMGYYKNLAIDEQQQQENEEAEKLVAEQQAAQEEAYYWYVLQEFTALCKIFGLEKVHADLKSLREHIEKDKPRIVLPNQCC